MNTLDELQPADIRDIGLFLRRPTLAELFPIHKSGDEAQSRIRETFPPHHLEHESVRHHEQVNEVKVTPLFVVEGRRRIQHRSREAPLYAAVPNAGPQPPADT